jgi:hypothetical protein
MVMMDAPRALCRFYAADGQLLAIGSSIEPGVRWKTYGTGRTWWLEVARVDLQHLPDGADVEAALAAAIDAEGPKYRTERPDFDAMTDAEVTAWFDGKTNHELLELFHDPDIWNVMRRRLKWKKIRTRGNPPADGIPVHVELLLPMALDDWLKDVGGTDLRERSRIIADAVVAYMKRADARSQH